MRPIDKGASPYSKISHYQEAEPYLNKRIGRYCSFCEMPIFHVPEVEHREGKASGGDLTAWENLLYGCKYCNTRKSKVVAAGEKNQYLWPPYPHTHKRSLPGQLGNVCLLNNSGKKKKTSPFY